MFSLPVRDAVIPAAPRGHPAFDTGRTRPRLPSAPAWRILLALLASLFAKLPSAHSAQAQQPPAPDSWPSYTLQLDQWWLLNLPRAQRVDASGLLRFHDGELWIVNDQNAAVYRLQFKDATNDVDLIRVEGLLTAEQTTALNRNSRLRLDCEGLARDDQGRIYISEESRRMILRWDPASQAIERLPIDWEPVKQFFHGSDLNASFEGVAVGGSKLYVANERQTGRIIVVDLHSFRILDHFTVASARSTTRDTHYTDLCWAENALWALLRDERKVLKVDPTRHAVLAEFDFAEVETAPQTAYGLIYAPGFMEGLAVDDQYLWLLSDNNGMGRRARGQDSRPTLFRCRRPDRP